MPIDFQHAPRVHVYGDGKGSVFLVVKHTEDSPPVEVRLSLTQFSVLCENRLMIEEEAQGLGVHK